VPSDDLEWRAQLRARLLRMSSSQPQTATRYEPPSRSANPPLESLVQGEWVTTAEGRYFLSEQVYPLDHRHGELCLGAWNQLSGEQWSPFVLDPEGQGFEPRNALFFDLETTGLGRGTGTYAFLVGVGFFVDNGFVARQYFMPSYADEKALLQALARDLAEHPALVSFNGRTFDWPILQTRYIVSRCPLPQQGDLHLDLLPLARRLWRRTLDSCALSSLETSVLGVRRNGSDVPGFLIPTLYQEYIREGRTRPIARIFYHNVIDLLSMVTLAAKAGQVLQTTLDPQESLPCDYLSLAILYEHMDRVEDALRAYQLANERPTSPEEAETAYKRQTLLLKRLGRYDEAAEIWRKQMNRRDIFPYVELAKYLEHRLRDYAAAEQVVQEAVCWLQQPNRSLREAERRHLLAELQHRLSRVQRRLQNAPECIGQEDANTASP
jgi:uncharacterized protein YprB with RNaseH-like and TPR domain